MTAFSGWENFYVVVGSSAGALIGLQFVVITLIADIPIGKDAERAGSAFATPTIVHFCAALFVAVIGSVPWKTIGIAAAVWGLLGLVGIIYQFVVARRVRLQTAYSPQFEDTLFHILLPLVAYAALAGSAFAAFSHVVAALFGVAGSAVLLLYIGIHNAWDAVTYHVFTVKRKVQEREPRK